MIEIFCGANPQRLKKIKRKNMIYFPENSIDNTEEVYLAKKISKKEDNIAILTNSAMFVEAMEVFTEYYKKDAKFYLIEEEIDRKYLYRLYDELGKGYDIIDKYRAENIYNKQGD